MDIVNLMHISPIQAASNSDRRPTDCFHLFDQAQWRKILMRLVLPLLIFSLSGCGTAIVAGGIIERNLKDRENAREGERARTEKERQWKANSLRIAACAGEPAAFDKELRSGRHDADSKQRALEDCIIPQSNVAGLRSLLSDLQSENKEKDGYCAYLAPALTSLDTRLLDIFVEQRLSLTCKSRSYPEDQFARNASQRPPSWWDVFVRRSNIPAAQLIPALRYLQAHDVDLKRIVAGNSLLLLAVESRNTAAIHFALDLGMDPDDPAYKWDKPSPLETWVLQRFSYTRFYTSEDAQSLQARLGEMTVAQAESMARKLHKKVNLEMLANGGADMLAYLIQSGASMRRLNSGGNLIFGNTRMSAELLAALNQLNDTQLAEFICPELNEYHQPYPLFAKAIADKNEPLVTFLKQRKMPETCPALSQ